MKLTRNPFVHALSLAQSATSNLPIGTNRKRASARHSSLRRCSLISLSALTLIGSHSAEAADLTWDGGGTDNNWNTAANWNAAIANGDSLFFDGTTRLTPTNNTTANSDYNITFNSGAGAFTLSGNAIDLLSGGFIVNNSANAQAVNHAVELLGNGTLTSNGGTLTIGGVITEAGGAVKTLNVNGAGNVTISGAISASNSDLDLIKTGSGTLTLSGNNSGLNDNDVIVNAGTLLLDYSTQNNTKLDTSVLTLGGGTVTLSGGTFDQNTASTTLTAGASSITRSSGTATLQMNTITRNVGATLNIGADNGDIANNDGGQNDGIIGGYFTVAGTTWATNGGDTTNGAITGLATYETSTTQGNWAATENISLTANPTASVTTRTINSLRLTDAVTFTITAANTLTLDTGGLLATGSGATTITGGTLTITGGATDLVVHQYSSANMTINSVIANTTGVDGLTKTGTGRLVLGNANTYTGETFVNRGILSISANNNLGAAGTGAQLNLDGGTLEATSTFGLFNVNPGTNNRAVTLADNGGTIAVTGSNTLTIAGVVSGIGNLTKSDTGTLAVTNANTYTGLTTIDDGTLFVNNASGSATGTGAISVAAAGILAGSGTITPSGTNGISVSGVLAPGASVGTIGNLTLNLGSTSGTVAMITGASFQYDLGVAGVDINTVGTGDLLTLAGAAANNFAFTGNSIDFLGTGGVGYYKIFDTSTNLANTWTGLTVGGTGLITAGLSVSNLTGGLSGNLIMGGNSLGGTAGDIYLQVIPEPSAALLAGIGSLLLLRRRRES